jgi:IstB-like ATP binding protein
MGGPRTHHDARQPDGFPGFGVVFLGPPGTGTTHLAIGISIRACQAGHHILFTTAAEWVNRLAQAHAAGPGPPPIPKVLGEKKPEGETTPPNSLRS